MQASPEPRSPPGQNLASRPPPNPAWLTEGPAGSESFESTIGYAYDAGNRLTQAADSDAGTFARSYDAMDHVASEVGPQGTVSYTHDAAGRRTSLSVPGQAPVTYSYDDANRLTTLGRPGHAVTRSYDQAGRRSATVLPNGITQAYSYDAASNVTGITFDHAGAAMGELNYDLDAVGRRVATWGSYARTNLPQPMDSASYDAANQRTAQDGAAIAYDANGNLASEPGTSYSWDARNQLKQVSGGTPGTFSYDPFGRRLSKTIDGQRTDFLYDGDNVVQEQSGGGATANLLTGLGYDEVFSRNSLGNSRSYLADAVGSTLALTDTFGTLTTSYTYDPFGNTSQTGAASDNPFQYTGRENDGNGLYHYRARNYSPSMQRFISEDPIGLAGGDTNLYAYVGGDPTSYTDPSGLARKDCGEEDGNSLLDQGWDGLRQAGDDAVAYWAEESVDEGNSGIGQAGASILGGFASLANCDNAGETAWAVAPTGPFTLMARGWRARAGLHRAHHTFGQIGKRRHLQVNVWKKGQKGSGRAIRLPLP